MVDLLASEYGWDMGKCLDTPIDVLAALRHALLCRKGIECSFTEGRDTDDDSTLADKVSDILKQIDKNP